MRLRTVREHDLIRAHIASEQSGERAQRQRDPGEARVPGAAPGAECEAPRIWQLRGEGPRCPVRPLTPQVRVI